MRITPVLLGISRMLLPAHGGSAKRSMHAGVPSIFSVKKQWPIFRISLATQRIGFVGNPYGVRQTRVDAWV